MNSESNYRIGYRRFRIPTNRGVESEILKNKKHIAKLIYQILM